MPDGREWVASVLGGGGQEFGLAVYARLQEFVTMLTAPSFDEALGRLEDRVLALTYEPRSGLPRRMQREVASAGWEVADPEAYPVLIPLNTPGGGASRRDAGDLVMTLRAVAALAEGFPEALGRGGGTGGVRHGGAGGRRALRGVAG